MWGGNSLYNPYCAGKIWSMKTLSNILKIILIVTCFFSFTFVPADCFEITKKVKTVLRKKSLTTKPYMVQTYDEWLEEARDVGINQRKYEVPKPQINEKLNKIEDPMIFFTRYNVPIGGNEADLAKIRKEKILTSIGVSSPNFNNLAMSVYYYSPVHNQISSEVLVVPLDGSKSRINRILEAKILDNNKGRNLSSGTNEFRQDLYSTLTIVDWSKNGKVVLVKEKIGSTNSGIFRTNVWALFIPERSPSRYTFKGYPQLQKQISRYWRKNKNLILNAYRWDIKILGFSELSPSEVVVLAYAYEKNGTQIFLGSWSVDVYTGVVKLISLKNKNHNISTNGIVLKMRNE